MGHSSNGNTVVFQAEMPPLQLPKKVNFLCVAYIVSQCVHVRYVVLVIYYLTHFLVPDTDQQITRLQFSRLTVKRQHSLPLEFTSKQGAVISVTNKLATA